MLPLYSIYYCMHPDVMEKLNTFNQWLLLDFVCLVRVSSNIVIVHSKAQFEAGCNTMPSFPLFHLLLVHHVTSLD